MKTKFKKSAPTKQTAKASTALSLAQKTIKQLEAQVQDLKNAETVRLTPLDWKAVSEGGRQWLEAKRDKLAFAIRAYGPTSVATLTKEGFTKHDHGTLERCKAWSNERLAEEILRLSTGCD